MTMFTLYCDDSGTHDASPCAVAACYIAPVVQWEKFVEEWKEAGELEGFNRFHMADFVAKKGEFSSDEWNDDAKRKRVLRRLTLTIKTRATMCFFSVVEKSGYDLEMPREWRELHHLGDHYTFAVRMCLGRLLRWRLKRKHKWPIQFVFDRMSKGKGQIDRVFEHHLSGGDDAALEVGIIKGGWSFQDSNIVLPLQASDMLAWETLWHMQNRVLARKKRDNRKSYDALLRLPFEGGYHDQQSIRALVAHWKKNRDINLTNLAS